MFMVSAFMLCIKRVLLLRDDDLCAYQTPLPITPELAMRNVSAVWRYESRFINDSAPFVCRVCEDLARA